MLLMVLLVDFNVVNVIMLHSYIMMIFTLLCMDQICFV